MSKDYIFEPRPTFSAYTPNLFLGSYYIEDDFQSDPSMWADPLEDAFVTNAGMKEGKIDTTTYLNDFSAETLLMETKKLDDLEVLPQSYFWKWDHYDAQLQIPTEISEDDFESPAYEEFLEAAVGYDSDNPYFLLVVDSFMDDGEDIDIWAEEADWTRIQTTVRWWKLYDLWMEAEGVDFLTNLAHEDYDWSIRNAGDLQNIGYEIPEPDDDDYYWSMRQAESFAAGNSNHWMTFGQVDYNWATDPDDIPLTDEEFWDIEEWVRKEIRWEIDDDNMPGESSITWTAGLPVTHRFTIHYSWGPAQTTGVNSAEGFEAEMGDLVKDNEWIVFGTKKTGGTTQGNQGMMLGRSPSLKGAKKMMDNFRKKGYGNRYATIGKRLKRQKALLGGLLEAEGSTDMRMPLEVLAGRRAVLGLAGLNDVCWRCSEYGDKIPSHCKNCGVCEECECAVECESRETLGSETLVWKDKTLSFMDWAKQEEASHLKKYAAETFMPPVHKDECTVCVGFADLKDLAPEYGVFLLCDDCITKAKTMSAESKNLSKEDRRKIWMRRKKGSDFHAEDEDPADLYSQWDRVVREDLTLEESGISYEVIDSVGEGADVVVQNGVLLIPRHLYEEVAESLSSGGEAIQSMADTSKPFFWNGMPENEFITKSGEVAEWIMQYEYGPIENWWVWQGDGPEDPDDPDEWGYVDTGAEGLYLGVTMFIRKLNGYPYDEVPIENLDIDDRLNVWEGHSMKGLWTNEPTISEDYDSLIFEAPYAGPGATMDIGKDTALSSFTPEELTTSSAIHGDFDQASLDYSGHQNIEVRAEGWGKTCQVEDRDTDEPCTAPATVNLQDILMEYEVGSDPYEKMHLGEINEFFCKKHYDEMDDMWAETKGSEHQNIEVRAESSYHLSNTMDESQQEDTDNLKARASSPIIADYVQAMAEWGFNNQDHLLLWESMCLVVEADERGEFDEHIEMLEDNWVGEAERYGKRQRFGNRYVARNTQGEFISNVGVGASLKADRRNKSKTPASSGFGNKGDSQKTPPTWAKPLGYVGALAAGWISASMIDKAKE